MDSDFPGGQTKQIKNTRQNKQANDMRSCAVTRSAEDEELVGKVSIAIPISIIS